MGRTAVRTHFVYDMFPTLRFRLNESIHVGQFRRSLRMLGINLKLHALAVGQAPSRVASGMC